MCMIDGRMGELRSTMRLNILAAPVLLSRLETFHFEAGFGYNADLLLHCRPGWFPDPGFPANGVPGWRTNVTGTTSIPQKSRRSTNFMLLKFASWTNTLRAVSASVCGRSHLPHALGKPHLVIARLLTLSRCTLQDLKIQLFDLLKASLQIRLRVSPPRQHLGSR
jgi:hypothetical protein